MTVTNACTVFTSRFRTALAEAFGAVDERGRVVWFGFLRPGTEEADVARATATLERRGARLVEDAERCTGLRARVDELLAGRRRQLDLPLALHGTAFQLEVWRELQRIPYAETISYAELAARIGKPRAVRAVARANATNPVSLAVPCHRVIGSDGSLTGYAGGVEVKRALLALERHGDAAVSPPREAGSVSSLPAASRPSAWPAP